MNDWKDLSYSAYKEYLDGLIKANISYSVKKRLDFIIRINNCKTKKHYLDMKTAQKAVDKFIINHIYKYGNSHPENFKRD